MGRERDTGGRTDVGRMYSEAEVRTMLAQHDARYRRELDALLSQLDALIDEVRELAEATTR